MRKGFIVLSFIFLSASLAPPLAGLASAEIIVKEFKDPAKIYEDTAVIEGRLAGIRTLEANGLHIPYEPLNDTFKCGLILNPGKNLVEITAGDRAGRSFSKKFRVLRLLTFPDIEETYSGRPYWARQSIIDMATLGRIEGYPDGNFYPNQPITRAEFITWLVKSKKVPLPELSEDVFFDVPKEYWRAPYIKVAVDAGYIEVTGEQFRPDDLITRAEAADIVRRAERLDLMVDAQRFFLDVPAEAKEAGAIYAAQKGKLLKGLPGKVYEPNRDLTRAEAAILFFRFPSAQASIEHLYNFNKGYDRQVYCKIDANPVIKSFTVEPKAINTEEETTIKLRAEIAARSELAAISHVKIDLTAIGGLPDAEMFDDATHGDALALDRVYSLNLKIFVATSGAKDFQVTAVDEYGWEGTASTTLLVLE